MTILNSLANLKGSSITPAKSLTMAHSSALVQGTWEIRGLASGSSKSLILKGQVPMGLEKGKVQRKRGSSLRELGGGSRGYKGGGDRHKEDKEEESSFERFFAFFLLFVHFG